jgi:hypothetical protein
MIDLMPFCGKKTPGLARPFLIGGSIYATNGKIMVAIENDGRDGCAEAREHLRATILSIVEKAAGRSGEYVVPPPSKVQRYECSVCNGSGKVYTSPCPECSGEEKVSFENEYNYYECDCQTCDGEGKIDMVDANANDQTPSLVCGNCDGTGQVIRLTGQQVGAICISDINLELIATLPNARIMAVSSELDHEPVPFTFDGGHGVVMPCRIYGE